MTNNVIKSLPVELNSESRYSVRVRSFNSLGVASEWSESLVLDTSAAGLENARRLMLNGDGMVAYDSYGRMIFNYSSTPIIRTNFVTNPSFEVNTVGWDALSNSSISRVTDDFFVGLPTGGACLKVQSTSSSTNVGFLTSSTRRISADPGEPYTATAYIKVPPGQPAASFRIGFRFYSATNTLISESVSFAANQITSANNWVRISNIGTTAPDGTSTIGVVVYAYTSLTSGSYYLVDAVMVEQSSIIRDYFDGSTSLNQSEWTGVEHDSASSLDTNTIYSVNGGVFTESVIQTSREEFTGVKITKDGIRGYAPGATPTETFFLDAVTGALSINGAAPPSGDSVPVGGAATDVNSNSTNIVGGKIRTGSITSQGYIGVLDGSAFSTTGTNFNLDNGTITSKNWRINASGDVFFVGAVAGGTIDIGGSDSTSFHVDSIGNMWLGASSYGAAPFQVSSTGGLTASSAAITGNFSTGSYGSNRVSIVGSTLSIESVSGTSGYATSTLNFSSSGSLFSNITSNTGLSISGQTGGGNRSELVLAGYGGAPEAEFRLGGVTRFKVSLAFGSAFYTGLSVYGAFDTTGAATVGGQVICYGSGMVYAGSTIVGSANAMGLRWDAGFATIMGTVDNAVYAGLGTVSDRRLKSDISELGSVKEKILQLRPVTFVGKDFDGSVPTPDRRLTGLIADETEKIIPSIVLGEATETTYQSVNYALITPFLIKALQEAFEENEDLKRRITSIENMI